MKKIIIGTILLFFVLTSCNGQKKVDQAFNKLDTIKPKTNFSVHKEYDEYGNLISMDSTYFYSNIKNDSLLEKQLFNKLKSNFSNRNHSIDSLLMHDFFSGEPFKMEDFYSNDFFENGFLLQQKGIREIFKEMDSLKNKYYKEKQLELQKNKI